MEIQLSNEVLKGLPEPDSQGVVRVTAGLRLSPDGKATLIEVNDAPVDEEPKDENEMESQDVEDFEPPSSEEVDKAIYG